MTIAELLARIADCLPGTTVLIDTPYSTYDVSSVDIDMDAATGAELVIIRADR